VPHRHHHVGPQLANTIDDVFWLLCISGYDEDHDSENLIIPSISFNNPIVALICELIASLCTGTQEDRSDAAASLVSLAHQSDRYGKIIIEEGGVGPLLKLMDEGFTEGQKNAARAISHLKVINSVVILITSTSMRVRISVNVRTWFPVQCSDNEYVDSKWIRTRTTCIIS